MRTIWDLRNLVEIGAYKSRHLCMLWRIKKKSKTHYDGGHLVEIGTYKSQTHYDGGNLVEIGAYKSQHLCPKFRLYIIK